MATGLPTILGWYVHEWLWRGGTEQLNTRVREIAALFESDDLAATKNVIKKYGVKYIILGRLERQKFKKINENKLLNMGKVVFESHETKIIKLD